MRLLTHGPPVRPAPPSASPGPPLAGPAPADQESELGRELLDSALLVLGCFACSALLVVLLLAAAWLLS